jgi:hypothetical protein
MKGFDVTSTGSCARCHKIARPASSSDLHERYPDSGHRFLLLPWLAGQTNNGHFLRSCGR